MSIENEVEWFIKLKEEIIEESKNGMKVISKDWGSIKKQYEVYKSNGLDVNTAFQYALRDCGYGK